MFDPKCHELAQHFLPTPETPPAHLDDLAQCIQDAIEDYLSGRETAGFTPEGNARIFGLD